MLTNEPCLTSFCPGRQDLRHPLRVKPTLSTTLSCGATISHSLCAGLPPLPAQLLVGKWHPGLVSPGLGAGVAAGSRVAWGARDDGNELSTAPREHLGCYHKGWPGVTFN